MSPEKKRRLTVAAAEPFRTQLLHALPSSFEVSEARNEIDVTRAVEGASDIVLLHEHFLGHEAGWALAAQLSKRPQTARLVVMFEAGRSYRFLYREREEYVPVETAQLPMTEEALLYQLSTEPPALNG